MREFVFTWYKNVKVGEPIIRKNSIQVIEEDFATAAHKATNLFCSQFGNLKKNTIVQIQEMQNGQAVGEPIVPQEESSIIPMKK